MIQRAFRRDRRRRTLQLENRPHLLVDLLDAQLGVLGGHGILLLDEHEVQCNGDKREGPEPEVAGQSDERNLERGRTKVLVAGAAVSSDEVRRLTDLNSTLLNERKTVNERK